MLRRLWLAPLLALAPGSALAQQAVVVSQAPLSSSVTVYRDTNREEGRFNLRWLRGYALISEKRRVSLPAGDAVVRFEGVADGMIAVSAVVTGLPGGIEEKNRDARLLSPASLLDGSLGNRVHLRRTDRATGRVTETDAIIRSGPDNAVVLETPQGIEALRCSGLPETLVYDRVPEGLSAKPTFSVQTRSPQATEAEVTLTYLATGFDWGASYVATIAEDGRTLDLFAWLTVANGNGAQFDRAQLLAVAGQPNRSSDFDALVERPPPPVLRLSCWPMDSTSTRPGPPPPPPPPPAPMMAATADILVTAQRRTEKAGFSVIAAQEELGDLKLYRVPVPVDVLPNGQKQVAMIQREGVPFTSFHAGALEPWREETASVPLARMLRMDNREKGGLGLPLPSGSVAVMRRRSSDELLLADSTMKDRAIGEKVEIAAGLSDQLRLSQTVTASTEKERRYRLVLTNATNAGAAVEIAIPRLDGFDLATPGRLKDKDGGKLWSVTVPANGEANLDVVYRRQ
ncbi:hypothetical protein GCM10007897_42720 [Sphingobium jiangsuense]|uniref:DUF4139 domain-containing protein n=1 Tax=Sphingobium jiangsuense TaxID=870476 RepID=A0A7W6BFZ1_9SPHN|nr:hypothetical protein [Sphingobium jiangsuense]MBB3926193.1 hypothetical protein [Sphingobium jiangsuense]GLT02847.1 hypothetical protein GCM10007897_42720 [Sphingobium jiangsuense]